MAVRRLDDHQTHFEPRHDCAECREEERERTQTCGGCSEVKDDVEERYSFGIYAGRFCVECARSHYKDGCGVDGPQGRVEELHEFEAGGYAAIEGEEE